MTKAQCVRALAKLGLELTKESGKSPDGLGFYAVVDTIGRMSFAGDCRGNTVLDYTATAPEFWRMVEAEGRELAPFIEPCPHAEGECDFHDAEPDA